MVSVDGPATDSAFGSFPYEGTSKMKAEGKLKNYKRATLLNSSTGKPEEIELFDTNDEHNEDLLVFEPQHELKADLEKAFAPFTKLQKRILLRVLLQGQSVEEATKNSRLSRRWWANWLQTEAMPQLRTALSDYYVNGKLVLR